MEKVGAGEAISADSFRHGYAVPPPSAGRLLVVFRFCRDCLDFLGLRLFINIRTPSVSLRSTAPRLRRATRVGTWSPCSLPLAILPVSARSPFRCIPHCGRSTPNPLIRWRLLVDLAAGFYCRTNLLSQSRTPSRSDRFNWGRGSPGGLGEEIEIFPGPLA